MVVDAAWLRSAVGTAHAATQALGLLELVTVERHSKPDAFGTPSAALAPPELYEALVQRKEGTLPTTGGQEVKYQAAIAFVAPVPLGPNDVVTLSDGITGPLYIPQGGLVDPTTGEPYTRTVYLRQ